MISPVRTPSGFNLRDGIPGLLFSAVGIAFTLESLIHLSGEAESQIGAGTFPTLLGVILTGFGGVLLARAVRDAGYKIQVVPLRTMLPVLIAPIFFGLTIRGAGMVVAVSGAVALASLAQPNIRLPTRLWVVALITSVCVAVFIYGIKLPYGLFGPWFGG